jgi:dTDP-glucose pyrophosphorylase
MKALILAGGRGKRLAEISNDKNKCIVEVRGKPLIEYSLDWASKTDISEIVIVVGYMANQIIDTYGDEYNKKPIKYVIQKEQKGLVHAIECAEQAINKEDFMLMLGDELMIRPRHSKMIKKYYDEDTFGLCGVVVVEDKNLIKKTYSIIQEKDNKIIRLVEKPDNPTNNIMGTGNCIFKNEIFSYIPQTPINQKRGEKELPDLIQCAIDDGKVVKSFAVCDKYFNLNFKEDIKDAESYYSHF